MKHLGSALTLSATLLCTGASLGETKARTSAEPQAPAPVRDLQPAAALPELPIVQYELANGLTVLLSEDHHVPAVAVEVLYLVGSGHEPTGKTGFAHLFEHLMFQGSKNYDQEYFTPYEPIGAEVNGTTNEDRTNYFEQVPSQYADLPLWLESDRMRSLPDVLSQQKLDNQRDVVKNERRQRYENTPYGMAFWHLHDALYPSGHPYQHSTIGSHEDLTAATLADVKDFFKTYYVPRNAAVVIVGDFEQTSMRRQVEHYFGDIPAGERAAVPVATRPVLEHGVHWTVEDEIELPRVYYAWHTPALFAEGDAELDLLSGVLADGKSSRLFHSLVYDKKLAKDVEAYQISQKLSSVYVISATAAPGTSLDSLAAALQSELKTALSKPLTEAELTRARNAYKKGFFGHMETYSSRASQLASYFLFTGKGDFVRQDYARYVDASAQTVLEAGQQFLRDKNFVRLDFIPGSKSAAVRKAGENIAAAPVPVTPAAAKESK